MRAYVSVSVCMCVRGYANACAFETFLQATHPPARRLAPGVGAEERRGALGIRTGVAGRAATTQVL